MITLQEYFGTFWNHPDATQERKANAERLLACVERLEAMALADGVEFPDNPVTGNGISGATYGGFRPQSCTQGAPNSSHKQGLAVDRYDPSNAIDDWCAANLADLETCGIYIEAPKSTPRWSHWTVRPPASGHRIFLP
jgi:hypothetical protein